jgi:hypothetical protein
MAIDRQAFKWAFKLTSMPEITELQKEIMTEMDAKDMKLK